MKQFFTPIFISLTFLASAQTFTEVPDAFLEDQLQFSDMDISDVDDDGDDDLVLIGEKTSTIYVAKLFENVDGQFIELENTPFVGVTAGSVRFGDIDGDEDEDLIIMGLEETQEYNCRIYENEDGMFTEIQTSTLPGFIFGDMEFSDFDGDDDLDLFLLGDDANQIRKTELYENTNGIFELVPSAIFDGLAQGALDLADVDGDGDEDLLITGENDEFQKITKLYRNTDGVFDNGATDPFDQLFFSHPNFHDYDGDGDFDLLLMGQVTFFNPRTKLYENNGSGMFTEVLSTPFIPQNSGRSAFGDYDGDGDDDLIILGLDEFSSTSTRYYSYEAGTYTEILENGLINIASGAVISSDFDGDGDLDLVLSGRNNSVGATRYYSNTLLTSTDDLIVSSGVRLFPNPTTADRINLEFEGTENGWINIQIFDITGRLLYQNAHYVVTGYQNIDLNLSEYSQGIYLLQLGEGVTRKFVVE